MGIAASTAVSLAIHILPPFCKIDIFPKISAAIFMGDVRRTRSTGENSTKSFVSWRSFASGKTIKSVVPQNGLGITERFFYSSPNDKQQVLMTIMLRIRLPPASAEITPARIVDLIKIAQAKHYRLSARVDSASLTTTLLADKASDLPVSYRFIERNGDNWMGVYLEEINANFAKENDQLLWRSAVIVPKEWMPAIDSECFKKVMEKKFCVFISLKIWQQTLLSSGNFQTTCQEDEFKSTVPVLENSNYFDLVTTFHHCLGDGLSMLAFVRTFMQSVNAGNINSNDLKLQEIEVVKDPPPVLDNLFDPNIFEVLPTATAMAMRALSKQKPKLGRPETDPGALSAMTNTRAGRSFTKTRFLFFPKEFTTALRNRSKSEKTTIAAVLIVASLIACRRVFGHAAARDKKDITNAVPNSQGWVLTSSIRHILPQSKLLQGGDRESDEALMLFGGYAGKGLLLNENRKIESKMQDRFPRMKVANYAYRRQKLWDMVEKRVDLSKMSKSFSVEVANLGAWEYPCAPPDAPANDQNARLDYFGGGLNSSFEGSRGLFSLGTVTFGGDMSVFVCYDAGSVTPDEADVFVKSFSGSLKALSSSKRNVAVKDFM
ncbi:hypothetical protein HDU82_005225 [Entophlyctis luteolus]|nr:hypothetical protein HDU82_005225 [Entophlyctis luteolus]